MTNVLRILRIQQSRIRRLIRETPDPDLRHELCMLDSENRGAQHHCLAEILERRLDHAYGLAERDERRLV